jgi:hypothetical protein
MTNEKYWERESPIALETDNNSMRLYLQGRKLQVSTRSWRDKSGAKQHGRTITLDLTDTRVVEFLNSIILKKSGAIDFRLDLTRKRNAELEG